MTFGIVTVMILHAAKIWTLFLFFSFVPTYSLIPIQVSPCSLMVYQYLKAVPTAPSVDSIVLHDSPRIPVLGGCGLTTISIASVSVVALQTCICFHLAIITVSPCELLLPCVCLYLAVKASLNLRLCLTTEPCSHRTPLAHMSCICWLARVITVTQKLSSLRLSWTP